MIVMIAHDLTFRPAMPEFVRVTSFSHVTHERSEPFHAREVQSAGDVSPALAVLWRSATETYRHLRMYASFFLQRKKKFGESRPAEERISADVFLGRAREPEWL